MEKKERTPAYHDLGRAGPDGAVRRSPASSDRQEMLPRRTRWLYSRWEDLREQQALALAYFDAFLIFAVVAVVLVLLMKRSAAKKGAHLAAE